MQVPRTSYLEIQIMRVTMYIVTGNNEHPNTKQDRIAF